MRARGGWSFQLGEKHKGMGFKDNEGQGSALDSLGPSRLGVLRTTAQTPTLVLRGRTPRGQADATSMPGFKNHVEWPLRSAANARKARAGENFSQLRLSGLRAKCFANLLIQRSRHANHG